MSDFNPSKSCDELESFSNAPVVVQTCTPGKSENQLESADSSPSEFKDPPKSKIEASKEFLDDAVLSATSIAAVVQKHFFCCVCGCPAGTKTYTCKDQGHPTCLDCRKELNVSRCMYVIDRGTDDTDPTLCASRLLRFNSSFREFIYKKTVVSCRYQSKGCEEKGRWNIIKSHQKNCKFAE